MKYLKKYNLFLEADGLEGTDDIRSVAEDPGLDSETKKTQSNALLDVQKNLKEFQAKRQQMENIFNDPKITKDSDLEQRLLSSVYNSKKENRQRNKFLKEFESILRQERRKKALQTAISKDEDRIKKTNDDINRLNDESNMEVTPDRASQIKVSLDRNRKKLVELRDNIQKNKTILNRDVLNWQKKREDFKRDMKDEEERIKKLSSKI
jgi:hypothetical protein